MTTVTSVKMHSYKQVKRPAGESYEADDGDALILLKIGCVTVGPPRRVVKRPIPESARKPPPEGPTTAEAAEPAADPDAQPAGKRDSRGRFYRRRDLKAEGTE